MLVNIKAEMARHGKKNADMASALGMSETSFGMKLNEKREFTLNEQRCLMCQLIILQGLTPTKGQVEREPRSNVWKRGEKRG